VALAAMPQFVTDRIVDKIMDIGNKYVHGPFTKGGGDEQVTRDLVSDVVVPAKWGKALLDASRGASTGSIVKDTPGYSQEHGVPLPKGAKVGLAPASSPAPPVEIVVNPEIHPPVSSVPAPPDVPAPPSANSAPAPALAVDPGHPDRPNDQHEGANNQTIAAPPPAGAHVEPSNQQTIGPNGNPLLQVGNATLAQARTGQEPTINGPEIHPSELTATPATAAPKPLPAPSQNLDNFVDDDDFDSGLAHLTPSFPAEAPPALAQAPPAPSGSGQHVRNPMGDFTGADHGGVVERSASNQPTIGPNPLLRVGNESLAQAPTREVPTINNGPEIIRPKPL
jgi:hypothetical protein